MTISFTNQGLSLVDNHDKCGQVAWRSPSNIALIKYWGKRPVQLPQNASISYTLSDAHTDTTVVYSPRNSNKPWVSFLFEGKEEAHFAKRIEDFISSLKLYFPFLSQLQLQISSSNSFPHSSGIASSASSMSALAMCLCDIERELFGTLEDENSFVQKASYIARLGSGSAARSVYPLLASWGIHEDLPQSSDLYATLYNDVSNVYKSMHDDVLIVSKEKKSVSSTAGHALMETNPFAKIRYTQASKNMTELLNSMKTGDLEQWGKIVEEEALTLHALMMCSDPSFILMKPNTLAVIDKIRAFRKQTKLPLFFTLDAGPNVHILYPENITKEAQAFINSQLLSYAEGGLIIRDQVGTGPKKLGIL